MFLRDYALELTNLVVGADWGAKICWAGVFGRDGYCRVSLGSGGGRALIGDGAVYVV